MKSKNEKKYYVEYKIKGNDRVRTVTVKSTSKEDVKKQVKEMFGKHSDVKVIFLEITDTNKLK